MEKDEKTRLYYHHDARPRDKTPSKIQEAWPHFVGHGNNNWTTGQVADETYASADFICVSCLMPKEKGKDHWIVTVPGVQNSRFEVDYIGMGENNYAHLAQKLEERSSKKGLTIIIY